jgi:hypothetical protein
MTDTTDSFEEIKAQLEHPYIRERQAALEKIRGKLERDEDVRECIEALQKVMRENEYIIVANQARTILDDWQRRSEVVRLPDDREHTFGVVCPFCGFQNYYDRREVCASHGSIYLSVASEQGDKLLLDCQNEKCKKSFGVFVDCKGYK